MAVTDAEVRKIIHTSLRDLSGHIMTAETLLQAAFAQAGVPLPTPPTLVDTIGTWLAAHVVAITDPRLDATRRQQYSSAYVEGTLGTGLLYTPYGQMATVLDVTGTLAKTDPTSCLAKCAGAGGGAGAAGAPTPARILFV